jgi:flagellar biosynthesis protein FlhB
MAGEFDQAKTEAPTQHRRNEARREGQVAVSSDLVSSFVLLAGVVALILVSRTLADGLLEVVRVDLRRIGFGTDLDAEQVKQMFSGMFWQVMELLGFVMALLFVTASTAGALQAGFYLTPHLLVPDWERLSPARGWTRIASAASAMRGLIAVAKIIVIFLVAYWALKGRAQEIGHLQEVTLASAIPEAGKIIAHLALAIVGTLTLLGGADCFWQRWRLEKSLQMSRQEVKEEVKREEGDPLVKGRVKKLQREAAAKRMLLDVPKATLVITNPTHLAVAMRYERSTMRAPKVLAKGAGFVAARIVEVARRHGVPVLERKPLAQAIFKGVKVGQEIPVALYQAVAELLAYLFRIRGQ